MNRALLTTPPGSQDLVPADVRRRRGIQHAWLEVASARGYEEVIPPTFEYEEVFTRGAADALHERLIRFVDRDGRVVALRADFTSAIARLAATRLADAPLPLRLCYAGKVYRQQREGHGLARELFQLGAELIGDASAAADVELLRLVIATLRALGVAAFQVNLGEVRFVHALLGGFAPHVAATLREAVDQKDRAALAAAAAALGTSASGAAARALAELPELIGRGDMLHRAAALAPDAAAGAGIARLREIDALLTEDERAHVVYDLGEVRGMDYYTGMHFEVFVANVGRTVGAGGRYDDLLAHYGADRAAVGFALETDALAALLAAQA